ncbi:glycine betaine/proline transport system substrate-binding protein [Paracoccus aminovorans]|uniref:Glycine betaine/proline transport system substrate-binding protein n=1 Tax=Paracoccus aminovorans TaxID=34004 RepID=A0A1I3B0W6_9RHOB|nr:choline ABC transporter substrate-binding protein [Paracoccus aminovorans]CQR85262.1 ABC-type proline/glycine betaine transport systems, periplasmic component [Paracoccus aminovorans]SFH55965.1 glycine betaine/proline transport system substrate-binding protein [Paracoccus aminovorans]
MQRNVLISQTALVLALTAVPALANDPQACATVHLSDPGWTDITATNGVATAVLQGLGYTPDVVTLSVPIGYEALKSGKTDVFLGNWMPAQQTFRDDLDASGKVEELVQNLEGAKFTLAVTDAAKDLDVKDFADLDAHKDAFQGKIYGIEPGAPANQTIQKMIDADKFGLGDWELIESGEQAMLAQVARNDAAGTPSVFLAWAPHPMNVKFAISYLSGGDEEFGPDFGGATVHTVARKDWVAQCPNVARLFKQLTFSVDMENVLMGNILDDGIAPAAAAKAWIAANPAPAAKWLEGVTTLDGKPGLDALMASVQ